MSWLHVNTPIELFWWHFNVVRKKHAERTPCLHSTGVHSFNTDTPERHPENTRDLVFKKGKGGGLKMGDTRDACAIYEHSDFSTFSLPDTITSWVVIFILPINSALNPIIYTLTTRPFKEMIYQLWYNYRQRRSVDRKETPKAFAPSFIWVEMWPVQEMPAEFMKPAVFTDPCNLSLVSQSSRLNSYS